MKPPNDKPLSLLKFLLIFLAFIVMSILFGCSVQKPVVKKFEVIKVYDGFFAAKNGKTVLLFEIQDSVFVGKVIDVSIGRASSR